MNIITNVNNFIKIASSPANNTPVLILKEALQANIQISFMIDLANRYLVNDKNIVANMDVAYKVLVNNMEFALTQEDEDSTYYVQYEADRAVENWLFAFATNNRGNFVEVVNGLIAEAQRK